MNRLLCLLAVLFCLSSSLKAADYLIFNESDLFNAISTIEGASDLENNIFIQSQFTVNGDIDIELTGARNLLINTSTFNLSFTGNLRINVPEGTLTFTGVIEGLLPDSDVYIQANSGQITLLAGPITIGELGNVTINPGTLGGVLTISADSLLTLDPRIKPAEFALAPLLILQATRSVTNLMGSVLDGQRDGAGDDFAFQMIDPDLRLNSLNSLLAANGTTAPSGLELAKPVAAPDARDWDFFVKGFGALGDVDPRGNAGAYEFQTAGVVAGASRRISDNWLLGVFSAYNSTHADFDRINGDMDIHSERFGVHSTGWIAEKTWFEVLAGGGISQIESNREVLGTTPTGSSDGWELFAQAAVGYDIELNEYKTGPYARLAYAHSAISSYREENSDFALEYQGYEVDSLASSLGWRVERLFKLGGLRLKPALQASWRHEYLDDTASVDASLANFGGSAFSMESPSLGRDSVVASATLDILISETISSRIGYEAEANAEILIHTIDAGLKVRF